MPSDLETKLKDLVLAIRRHRATVDAHAKRLRRPEIIGRFDKQNPHAWCLAVMGDALVRVRLLLEQNFNFVETIGIVAVARYLFELSVWLRLFEEEPRYGLVYYGEWLETQRKYLEDQKAQLGREIEILKSFEKKEQESRAAVMRERRGAVELSRRLTMVQQTIDADAARHFSIYAEQARVNGYGFQAYLVERKAVPDAEASLKALDGEIAEFAAGVRPTIGDLVLSIKGKRKRWEWKNMAEKAGIIDQYDFLYTTASKLLHATPVSISTDQKNLEPQEMLLFLRYINVKIVELVDLAKGYPRISA